MTITVKNLYTGKKLTAAVAAVTKAHKELEQEIHLVACSALYHALKHYNATPMQDLLAGLGGSVRRNALIEWAVEYGHFAVNEEGKNVVYERREDADFDAAKSLEQAMLVPFWEYKKEAPFIPFDLSAELEKLVKRAEKAAKDERNTLDDASFRALRELAKSAPQTVLKAVA